MSKRSIEDVERELYMAQFRVKKCQYNDHLYDMEKWEYEVEILKDELKKMKMEQTAVEWLVQEVNKINVSTEARLFINKLKEQAKAMEKEKLESLKDFDTWKEWKNS